MRNSSIVRRFNRKINDITLQDQRDNFRAERLRENSFHKKTFEQSEKELLDNPFRESHRIFLPSKG